MSSFRNREYGAQLLDFKGMQFGKCKATDIDMSCDWQGKTFVFVEVKYGTAPLTLGQKIHLESLVNAITAGGKTAWAIVARHETPKGTDIEAATCQVDRVYGGQHWSYEPQGRTLKEVMTDLYNVHQMEYTNWSSK